MATDSTELDPETDDLSEAPDDAEARRPRRRRTPDAVIAAVERTLRVVHLPDDTSKALADALGVSSDDVAELAKATVTRGDQLQAAIAAVVELSTCDPIEAGVLATEMANDAAAFRSTWRLLSSLTNMGRVPVSAHAKAGLAVARAAQGLDSKSKQSLAAMLAVFAV